MHKSITPRTESDSCDTIMGSMTSSPSASQEEEEEERPPPEFHWSALRPKLGSVLRVRAARLCKCPHE